jgi:hypothetical protein
MKIVLITASICTGLGALVLGRFLFAEIGIFVIGALAIGAAAAYAIYETESRK